MGWRCDCVAGGDNEQRSTRFALDDVGQVHGLIAGPRIGDDNLDGNLESGGGPSGSHGLNGLRVPNRPCRNGPGYLDAGRAHAVDRLGSQVGAGHIGVSGLGPSACRGGSLVDRGLDSSHILRIEAV